MSPRRARQLSCPVPSRAVPFLRSFNRNHREHFYTTTRKEHQVLTTTRGFVDEDIADYIYPAPDPHTVPAYRLYSANARDHLYTTNVHERNHAVQRRGYSDEGTDRWVFPDQQCGGLPFYRLNHAAVDHVYTPDVNERDGLIASGYVSEVVAAYF